MRFIVTISEVGDGDEASTIIRYQQTVDALDMQAVISAVNSNSAQQQRQRALRSDAGKPRARKEEEVT